MHVPPMNKPSNSPHKRPNAQRQQLLFALVRSGWASLLIGAPPRLLQTAGLPPHGPDAIVVRGLGLRHLVQAGAELAGGPRSLRNGALVDLAHGLSMLVLGGLDARRRKPALVDAAVATGFFAWGLALRADH